MSNFYNKLSNKNLHKIKFKKILQSNSNDLIIDSQNLLKFNKSKLSKWSKTKCSLSFFNYEVKLKLLLNYN